MFVLMSYRELFLANAAPQPWPCHFCSKAVPYVTTGPDKFTVHHLDGNHSNDDLNNLVPAHGRCHKSHHARQFVPVFSHTAVELGAMCRTRRTDLDLTQVVLADKAGVSVRWLKAFESGKSSVELGLVTRVLDALGLVIAATERPVSGPVDLDKVLSQY